MAIISQRSFSGGELAPALQARVDTVKYATGAKTIRNAMVLKSGGVANRPGTEFVGEVKDSTKTVRLIPWVFSKDLSYSLEFGDGYMRPLAAGTHIYDLTLTITGISNANPGVVTYTGTDPSAGEEVYISGVTGPIAQYVNNRNFLIGTVNAGANTFQLKNLDGTNFNTTSLGSYTSGGTAKRVYQITTPFTEDELFEISYAQSASQMVLTHRNHPPQYLTRASAASWSIGDMSFQPTMSATIQPVIPASTAGSHVVGSGSVDHYYVATVFNKETREESLASNELGLLNAATLNTTTNYNVIRLQGAVKATHMYNVYKKLNGVYGYLGSADYNDATYEDKGLVEPDLSDQPPVEREVFHMIGEYPGTVTFFQQRLAFANSDNDPEQVTLSKIGVPSNFTISEPIQDDDSISFALAGNQVCEVKHLVDLGAIVIFTSQGEFVAEGDGAGAVTPSQINLRQKSYYGSSKVRPIIIGNTALFVQALSSVIRDMGYDFSVSGYQSSDLTLFSAHLFKNKQVVDWCYQQNPHSIVWVVLSDGTLAALTYVKEHQIFAWHRHDTDGEVESIVCIPESTEDAVYVVVKREINGVEKRFIERMVPREDEVIEDCIYMDSVLSYDGRNTNASHTMTLSGGTAWDENETLTLTSSTSFFSSSSVGNSVQFVDADGELVAELEVTGYTSGTVVSVRPDRTVPAGYRSTAKSTWNYAVDEITGLWHLEGKDVSILADGYVIASPNNSEYATVTVTNGAITLDEPYAVIHIGLPFISDLEPLNIDVAQGETLSNKKILISEVTMNLENTRGIWVGPKEPEDSPLENLAELKIRDEEGYDDPVRLATEVVTVPILPEWNSNGRVFIRQVDPLPMSILAIHPTGLIPIKG